MAENNNDKIGIGDEEVTIESVKALMSKKDELEVEMEKIREFFTTGAGRVFGLNGPIVDREGFPHKDVELVIAVRTNRNQYSTMQSDHVSIMKRIEKDLATLHQKTKSQRSVESPPHVKTPHKTKEDEKEENPSYKPFARVNSVSERSPSETAALEKDDLIISFGSVGPFKDLDLNNPIPSSEECLRMISNVVRDSVNSPVRVTVLRDKIVHLVLTPRNWEGRGLLGCHLLPL